MGVITNQNQPVGLAVDNDCKFYVSELTTGKVHGITQMVANPMSSLV